MTNFFKRKPQHSVEGTKTTVVTEGTGNSQVKMASNRKSVHQSSSTQKLAPIFCKREKLPTKFTDKTACVNNTSIISLSDDEQEPGIIKSYTGNTVEESFFKPRSRQDFIPFYLTPKVRDLAVSPSVSCFWERLSAVSASLQDLLTTFHTPTRTMDRTLMGSDSSATGMRIFQTATVKGRAEYLQVLLRDEPSFNWDFHCRSMKAKLAAGGDIWSRSLSPVCAADFLGSTEAMAKVVAWLTNWKERVAGKLLKVGKGWVDYDSDFSDSSESRNGLSSLTLCGPIGCGKTSLVYALAAEHGFSVVELNPSSCRSGKALLAQLSDALDSNLITISSSSTTQSSRGDIAQMFTKVNTPSAGDRKRPHSGSSKLSATKRNKLHAESPEASHTGTSKSDRVGVSRRCIILLDEADVHFPEEDRGYVAALQQILQTARLPVVLTANTLDGLPSTGETVLLERPPPVAVQNYLRSVFLARGQACVDSSAELSLLAEKGDLRQALSQLQLGLRQSSKSSRDSLSAYDAKTFQGYASRMNSFVAQDVVSSRLENFSIEHCFVDSDFSQTEKRYQDCHLLDTVLREECITHSQSAAVLYTDYAPTIRAIDLNEKCRSQEDRGVRRATHYFRHWSPGAMSIANKLDMCFASTGLCTSGP